MIALLAPPLVLGLWLGMLGCNTPILGTSPPLSYTVIQWLNGTRFEGPERTASYQFAIGYIKGTGDVNAGDRIYNIMATAGALNPTGEHTRTYFFVGVVGIVYILFIYE